MSSATFPKLKAPIVLVHGLFGFDRVTVAGKIVLNYFPGIVDLLENAGNRVLVPCLSPTEGIADRALQLKRFLNRHCAGDAVHIVAHSMGGLDARYMISKLGMADRVLSLTTLGTPHHGTTFADWAIANTQWLLRPVLDYLGVPTQGFFDLTTASCKRFNSDVSDVPGVRYFSVAGQHDGTLLLPEWLLPYNIVQQREGPNDGVVSVTSATYGECLDVWQGDHFSLVNWLHPLGTNRTFDRDPSLRYNSILHRLADERF